MWDTAPAGAPVWDMAPQLSLALGKAGTRCHIPRAGTPGILTLPVLIAEETNKGRRLRKRQR